MNHEDKKIIEMLENTAQGIKPNIMFEHELETKLTAAHKPKRNLFGSLRQNIFPTLGWAAAIVALVLALNFATRSLLSGTPAAGDGFICPVTEPNGSLPPGETVPSPEYLGNGELWTVLWPDGKVMMEPHNLEADGSLSMKWGWVRAVTGALTIEGHRLDTDASVDAEPLRADIPDGYGDTGFQVSALIFPTTGCWEVTGRVGESSLTFVTEVMFNGATPTPIAIQEISTPIPSTPVATDGGYDWRGTKLTLSQPLPESPAEANVYSLKISQPATMDEARALAQQFGMNGEVSETPGQISGNFDYLLIDGKQKLTVRSDHYFTYYSDFENFTLGKLPGGQALAFIDNFLRQHGFNFGYNVEMAIENEGRQYGILPLTSDGYQMTFDFMMPIRFDVTLDDQSNIIFSGYSINPESVGRLGILTAEEAFQKVLDPNPQPGLMEIFHGTNGGGGGGGAFYKLNLSGTPVPSPTPPPTLTPSPLNTARIEGLRGMLSVVIHKQVGGTQVTEYSITGTDQSGQYYSLLLIGTSMQGLEKFHGRPIIVWGSENAGQFSINVERYEIPFPDLQFQIIRGRQELTNLDGQSAIIFTTEDGASYVQLAPAGNPTDAIIGIQGDLIELEVLIVPDETFGGLPVLRISAGSIIAEGSPGLTVTADQPYVYDDTESAAPQDYIPPTATIEKVELAYYIRNPIYSMTDPTAGADAQYLQPVWRFYGHYSNGDEFEILIQALKDEFLLPELAPYTLPG
ncbi:MAG: hypothetical protein HY864_17220 [Chloroflexi bacterium]|nr:hypothetical protein [Chloroflexota bacterium]